LTLAIRRLSGSAMTHCAIGYGGAVLNVTLRGNQFWPILAFAACWPRLCRVFEVPIDRAIDLDRYPAGDRKRIFPSIARWLTRGLVRTSDCVCITSELLRDGGVHVPNYIVSPVQLHDWLMARGFRYVELSP